MESEYSDRIHILSYPKKAGSRSFDLLSASLSLSIRNNGKCAKIATMKKRFNTVVDRSSLQKEEPVASPANEIPEKEPPVQKPKKKNHGMPILVGVVVLILLLLSVFKIYVDNDYKPIHSIEDYQAMTAMEIESSDNALAVQNPQAIAQKDAVGIILYGDERVQRECYLPFMIALAEQGYCVYLPTTFGNLPILNLEGAEYVIRTYRSVHTWYILAHGKACPVAARYASSHDSKINGLIYLGGASYHTDLSGKDLTLLSIVGTEDTLIAPDWAKTAKANDPAKSVYITISGGNHTGFLDTHLMRGDTPASLSSAEQIEQSVLAISSFLSKP